MVDNVFDNSFIWRQIKRQPLCESAKLPTNLQSTPFEERVGEMFLYKYSVFSLISPRTSGQCSVRCISPGLAGSATRQSLLSRLLHHRTVVSGLSDCQHDKIENTEKTSKIFLSMTLFFNTLNQRKMHGLHDSNVNKIWWKLSFN